MRISLCCTIYDRPINVIDTVFASLREQSHDEFIIVLDGTPPQLAEYIKNWWRGDDRTRFVSVMRPPGWRSPVKAWNRGYRMVTGDYLYCFSSETVQAAGNLAKMRALLEAEPQTLVFGKAECSCGPAGKEVDWGGTAPGNLLCDSYHPRPLGFIWAGPMKQVREIGGWDEAFDAGYWYDEADFFFRLWRTGLNFAFDDSVSGTHLHHERPELTLAGTRKNAAYQMWKHGSMDPLGQAAKYMSQTPGRTVWRHP